MNAFNIIKRGNDFDVEAAAPKSEPEYDFDVRLDGFNALVTPLSDSAKEWMEEHVESESYQWFGPALYVKSRYIGDLIDGILAADFTVRGNG